MADEGLTPNDFTESLVPDPSQPPPRTIVLEGLLGRSPKEGYWRLYFNEELSNYAEFREEDLRHHESIPREHYPLPGLEANKVWLDADAQVDFTNTESRRMQAEFLRGDIAEGSLMGAGMAGAVAAGGGGPLPGPSIAGPCGPPQTIPAICRPTSPQFGCPPQTIPAICRPTSPQFGCPPRTSPQFGCPPPTSPAFGCRRYTVQEGDTLFGIAELFYGDGNQWPRIWNANRAQIPDPDVIFPGQVLVIP
jgi:nucleoid-associated protein YgaU